MMDPIIIKVPVILELEITAKSAEKEKVDLSNFSFSQVTISADKGEPMKATFEGSTEKRHYKKRKKSREKKEKYSEHFNLCACGKKLHHTGRCKGFGRILGSRNKLKSAKEDKVWAEKLRKEQEYMAHARKELE